MVDLDGNEEISDLAPRDIRQVRWSRDGRSVAYVSVAEGDLDSDIYTYDVELGTTPRRITFEGINSSPAYSPDGTRVAFSSFRAGAIGWDLFVKSLDDDTPARSVASLAGDEFVTQWPSEILIVWEQLPNPSDLWMVDLSDPENPRIEEYLPSEADLDAIVISPDGTLAAYHSNQSGRDEVYLRSFPEPREPTLVSEGGGRFPQWAPDGSTVYYWTLPSGGASTFMAARVRRDPTTVVLSRDSLFSGSYNPSLTDLNADGDRLVIAQSVGGSTDGDRAGFEPERFLVVTNWFEELRGRLGN